MVHVGLDLCRTRLDVCVLAEDGTNLRTTTAPPDPDGLRVLVGELVLAAALDDHGMAELGDHGLAGLGGDIDTTPLSGRRATTPCRWREVVAVTPG